MLILSPSTLIRLRVYLDEFARQLAQRTPTSTTTPAYLKRARSFIAWLEQGRDPHLRQLDRACLHAYRVYLDQCFANPRTKNGALTAVRQFLSWLVPLHPELVNAAEWVQGWRCSQQHTRRHSPVEDVKALFVAAVGAQEGRGSADESVQVLQEVHERIQVYLALRPGPLRGSAPLFAT